MGYVLIQRSNVSSSGNATVINAQGGTLQNAEVRDSEARAGVNQTPAPKGSKKTATSKRVKPSSDGPKSSAQQD